MEMFHKMDTNNDKLVTECEMGIRYDLPVVIPLTDLRADFNVTDTNNDTFNSLSELLAANDSVDIMSYMPVYMLYLQYRYLTVHNNVSWSCN